VKPFENAFALFLALIGENGPKKASNSVISISVFGRFSVDNRLKRVSKSMRFHTKRIVWTGENKTQNASVGENILLRLRTLLKTHLCGRGASVQ